MSDYRGLVQRLRVVAKNGDDYVATLNAASAAAAAIESLEADLAAARDETAALREAAQEVVWAAGQVQCDCRERAQAAFDELFSAPSAAGTAWRAQVGKEAYQRGVEDMRLGCIEQLPVDSPWRFQLRHCADPAARRSGGAPTEPGETA